MIIYNKTLPFGPYKALAIWPFIFAKKKLDHIDINHEKIHHRQQLEMLLIFFPLMLGIDYVIKRIKYKEKYYRNLAIEREAYDNEFNLYYLKTRPFLNWIKYL